MTPVNIGAIAPDFDLAAAGGGRVKLSDFAGQAVVLYFYPKDDTPGCTKEIELALSITERRQSPMNLLAFIILLVLVLLVRLLFLRQIGL